MFKLECAACHVDVSAVPGQIRCRLTCSWGSRWVLLARMLNAVSGRFTVFL